MTDARKFCWGCFIGMTGMAALHNHGLWKAPQYVGGSGAGIIAVGLLLGCVAILIFGDRPSTQSGGTHDQ